MTISQFRVYSTRHVDINIKNLLLIYRYLIYKALDNNTKFLKILWDIYRLKWYARFNHNHLTSEINKSNINIESTDIYSYKIGGISIQAIKIWMTATTRLKLTTFINIPLFYHLFNKFCDCRDTSIHFFCQFSDSSTTIIYE